MRYYLWKLRLLYKKLRSKIPTWLQLLRVNRRKLILPLFLISITILALDIAYHGFFIVEWSGILQVETQTISVNRQFPAMETEQFVLASHQRRMRTVLFAGDSMTVYQVPNDCFESYLDDKQNKVLNRLDHIALQRRSGEIVQTDPAIIAAIFAQMEQLEHERWFNQILVIGDEYFIYSGLNVNWVDPCVLYYYSREKDQLIQLAEFDNQQVTRIKILSVEKLHEL